MRPKLDISRGVSWARVKARLGGLDRADLLELVRDLYGASLENQAFLHARFNLGSQPLLPYQKQIARWLFPDINQDYSVARAKAVITAYRRVPGSRAGVAELEVFFCEQATAFCADVALDDGAFYDALVRMFAAALRDTAGLDAPSADALWHRLDAVKAKAEDFGYGAGDGVAEAWGNALRMKPRR